MKFAKKTIKSGILIRQLADSWGNSPIGGIRGESRQLAKLLLAKKGIGDGILPLLNDIFYSTSVSDKSLSNLPRAPFSWKLCASNRLPA